MSELQRHERAQTTQEQQAKELLWLTRREVHSISFILFTLNSEAKIFDSVWTNIS